PATAATGASTNAVASNTAAAIDADGLDWNALYLAVVPAGTAIPISTTTTTANAPLASAPAAPAKGGWDGVDRRGENKPAAAASVKEESIRVDAVKLDALLEV